MLFKSHSFDSCLSCSCRANRRKKKCNCDRHRVVTGAADMSKSPYKSTVAHHPLVSTEDSPTADYIMSTDMTGLSSTTYSEVPDQSLHLLEVPDTNWTRRESESTNSSQGYGVSKIALWFPFNYNLIINKRNTGSDTSKVSEVSKITITQLSYECFFLIPY